MYRRLPQSHDNVMGYEVSGPITEDDFLEMVTELREAIDDFGGARVLVRAAELPSQEFLGAFGERIQFLADDLGRVERYAVVSDEAEPEAVSRLADRVTPTELKRFDSAREPEAWRWVSA